MGLPLWARKAAWQRFQLCALTYPPRKARSESHLLFTDSEPGSSPFRSLPEYRAEIVELVIGWVAEIQQSHPKNRAWTIARDWAGWLKDQVERNGTPYEGQILYSPQQRAIMRLGDALIAALPPLQPAESIALGQKMQATRKRNRRKGAHAA